MGRLACSIAIILAACGGGNTMTDGGGTPADGGGTPTDGGGTPTDGGGTPTDGGGTPTDGGVACANGTATLSDDCPFTACGGALDGTYCYTNVCLTRADVLPIGASVGPCMTSQLTLSDFRGTAAGSLVFTAGAVTRSLDVDATVTLGVPQSCSFGMCGTITTALQTALAQSPLDATVSCSAATGGGCDCALTLAFQSITADSYTAAGNTITLGTGRTYDYCAGTGTLSYRETTTGRMDVEPGVASLASR